MRAKHFRHRGFTLIELLVAITILAAVALLRFDLNPTWIVLAASAVGIARAAAGDSLQFAGYGGGATFTNIDATHWQVNYNGGGSHDVITFMNAAVIDVNDFAFE